MATTSLPSDVVLAQTGEIITVLCEARAFAAQCCNNFSTNGLTAAALLAALEIQFPGTGWTLEDLVFLVDLGKARGVLKCAEVEGEILHYINTSMVEVNPVNDKYRKYCSKILAKGVCTKRCNPASAPNY